MTVVLTLTCPDRPGIVAGLSEILAEKKCNILQSSQFFQPTPGTTRADGNGQFFLRVEFSAPASVSLEDLQNSIVGFSNEFDAETHLFTDGTPIKCIVMVSKFDHCLQDIFYRTKTGVLPIEIVAVVSNHDVTRADVERLGIPFHLLQVTPETKAEQEIRLDEIVSRTGAELVVLARYMQVLSDTFSSKHFGKIINIHHSFLPAFKGAKPYHRAYDRGVKMIGATAHYVTPDLDEGPIIEQDAERVTHALNADDLVAKGRAIEARVLSKAIQLHAERRVFINEHRTVVFER
ncbi:MAG: formyltetrahydrofolate deformylase [Alphaproteobacteria bacterium]